MPARPNPSSAAAGTKPTRRYAPRMPPEQRREQLVDAALRVTIEQGYGGVSIEAIARRAGVTRPVVYDHFPNLGSLLKALVEREERYSLQQLARVVPDDLGDGDPVEVLAGTVRRFLDAVTARPDTWRIILQPVEGMPAIVRERVETQRALILGRIEQMVRWAVKAGELPPELDVEVAALTIRDLGEQAGRMVLSDPERYSPDRYERFVQTVMKLLWPS